MTKPVVDIIQKILALFGLRITRLPRCVEPAMPFDVLELALQKMKSENESGFYFIQIGANDGVLNDSLNPLIRKYNLRGCLVEPMKDVFQILMQNYADQPQLDFRNVMIGGRDGVEEIHRFRRDAPVPQEFFHGLARQDSEYIKRRAKTEGLEAYTEAVQCEMVTFETLISGLPVEHVSMMYVDTEGSDDKIIEAAFQAGIFPPIINYEWTEIPLERRCALKMKLLDHGYRFLDVGADTVCLKVEDGQAKD